MSRRVLTGVLALSLVAGACGLGDKQAQADRIIGEGKRLMAKSSLTAVVGLDVEVVPAKLEVVLQEPPRIAQGTVTQLGALLRPRDDSAAVAGSLRFVGSAMYERIAPKSVSTGLAATGVPSNLYAIVAWLRGQQLSLPPAELSPTTSTTALRTLRRSVQIVREWAAFDFADIEDSDSTKHGGSFAINPVALLRLTTGVLTGSVERVSATEFRANVSRDKAERDLSEDAREVLDKMFTANAVTRRVFPARFVFDADGQLRSFEVTLRQHLSSKDRADATYSFALRSLPEEGDAIARPPRRGTVTANTLGELVTMVTGA